jgi:GTPase SAR1 family protein
MVKLLFKPTENNETVVSSITSKRPEYVDKDIRPFQKEQSEPDTQQTVPECLKLKDLIGLENCVYILDNWYKNPTKLLLLIGPTGCGKTTLIESYCRENEVQLYSIKSTDSTKTKRDLLKDLFAFAECSTTSFFIKRQTTNKKLILIDEYQNGQGDVLTITDINNLNLLRNEKTRIEHKRELKTFLGELDCPFSLPPIVVISADTKGSKLSDIKKTHEVYYIPETPPFALKKWINNIFKELDETFVTEIVKRCRSDKRLILNTINFILKNGKNEIDESFMELFYKDEELTITNFLELIFNEQSDINKIYKIYETDGFMISNLVHENYLEYNDDIDAIAKTADSISLGETLFSDTYESNRTFIPELHCLNSIVIPSYYSRSDRVNRNTRTSCINNRYNIYLNNLKIIDKINDKFYNKVSILDILTLKKFLNHNLVKTKVLSEHQLGFIKNILGSLGGNVEKMEFIYKHFSEFNDRESKPKVFTLKFKEKIKLNL